MSNLHPRRASKRAAALDAVNKIKSNLEDLNLCEESVDHLRRRQSDDSATLYVEESNEESETSPKANTKRTNDEAPVLADEFEFKEDDGSSLMDESIASSTDSKSTSCPSTTTSEESDDSADTVISDEFEFKEDESTLVDDSAAAADSKSTLCASTASEESNEESEESEDESSIEDETVREVTWSEWDRYQQYMHFKRLVEAKREARAAARCKHSDRKMVLSRRLSNNIKAPSFSPALSPVAAHRLRFSPEANTIAKTPDHYSMYFPAMKNKRQRKNY